jgi:heme exporter protein C
MEKIFKQSWWKFLGAMLLVAVIIGGLLIPLRTPNSEGFTFPNLAILYESIRNLFFHVPMWFGMVLVLLFSFVHSILFLSSNKIKFDIYASNAAKVGVLYGMLGIFTGMVWANYTWGAPWPNDPKLNGAAIAMLIYFAYIILRGSIEDEMQRAKISAVYNIFAYVIYIMFIFIIPRLTDSLHPGNGGNPGFGAYDLDNNLRLFFYPAILGWTLLAFWIISIKVRIDLLTQKIENDEIINHKNLK